MEPANLISEGTRVEGRISGDGPLTIAGEVEGSVVVSGGLAVARGAQLGADLEAATITVSGTVRGAIKASREVSLDATADVEGPIEAGRVRIAPEARFVGALKMPLDLPRGVGAGRERWS